MWYVCCHGKSAYSVLVSTVGTSNSGSPFSSYLLFSFGYLVSPYGLRILWIDCGGSCFAVIPPTTWSEYLCSTRFRNSPHLCFHHLGLHFRPARSRQSSPRRRRQSIPTNRLRHQQFRICTPPLSYAVVDSRSQQFPLSSTNCPERWEFTEQSGHLSFSALSFISSWASSVRRASISLPPQISSPR